MKVADVNERMHHAGIVYVENGRRTVLCSAMREPLMTGQQHLKSNTWTACGICRVVCPEHAIRMTRDMALPAPLAGACTGCNRCPAECPLDANDLAPPDSGDRHSQPIPPTVSDC